LICFTLEDKKENIMADGYRTYKILSFYEYQRVTSSSLQTIHHYNQTCYEDAELYGSHVMVLRENLTKILGYYYYGNGFPMQNLSERDGYVDVRTGKYYPDNTSSFFEDIQKI
jgi:hypothetical protein